MKKAKYVFIIFGLLLLIYLVKAFGLTTIIKHIEEMGWKFLIVAGIFIFSSVSFTLGWLVFIPGEISFIQFCKMILARIAGDSTTSINALGAIAGEPIKAMYISDFVPMNTGLASVILDRTMHNLSNTLIVLTGIIVSLFILDLPAYIILLCIAAELLILTAMIFIVIKQKSGFIEYVLTKMPSGITNRFLNEDKWKKIRLLDMEISSILRSKNHKRLYTSLAIHYFTTLIIASLEIYLIAVFIDSGCGMPLIHAMFLYIFGFILTSAIFFMPANVGTSEGSYALALTMLGYDPAMGITIGIIRRLRSFVWSGIGILILFYAGLFRKEKK